MDVLFFYEARLSRVVPILLPCRLLGRVLGKPSKLGVAASDSGIPLQKMIYVAAFQGGIEKFVTPLGHVSLDPVDRFISARTVGT